jgi:eukaryotic-like serine/threonine-protein kinase
VKSSTATSVTSVPAWTPGNRVGNYSLLAKLATGGMAEIWLARQQGLKGFERTVVVKRMIESLSADPAFVEMFLDEARIAAQLAHPNIVQIFDLGEYAGAYYLAMEYLPGEHLAQVARAAQRAGTPLSFQWAVKIVIDALEGLSHAHTRLGVDGKPLNVVHRDVSPQNIQVTTDGLVKVVDFGIARAANRATQTQGNMVKGKFAYMPPEQARSESLDGRADVFSVGAILFELVTRTRLWPIKDQVQLLTALIDPAPIAPVRERNREVPEDLAAIIDKALHKPVGKRWKTALEMKTALEAWLRAHGGGPSSSELSQLMHQLFPDRIKERTKLLEQAAKGHYVEVEQQAPVKPPTDRSMPGATPMSQVQAGASGKRWLLPVAAALSLGLGVAGYFALRAPPANEKTEVVEVKPPPAGLTPAVEQVPPERPPPAPRSAEIRVETEPAGAEITVDGTARGKAPLTVTELAPGAHKLEAALDGYVTHTRTVTLKNAGESATLVLPLVAEPQKKQPAAQVDKSPPAGKGKLTLSTDPWTRVMFKDKVLGDTPLIDAPLPAGKHRLRLVNEQSKIDLTIEVEVKAGQTTKKMLKL